MRWLTDRSIACQTALDPVTTHFVVQFHATPYKVYTFTKCYSVQSIRCTITIAISNVVSQSVIKLDRQCIVYFAFCTYRLSVWRDLTMTDIIKIMLIFVHNCDQLFTRPTRPVRLVRDQLFAGAIISGVQFWEREIGGCIIAFKSCWCNSWCNSSLHYQRLENAARVMLMAEN